VLNTRQGTGVSRLLCAFVLWGFLAAPAFGQQDSEQRKIEYLINAMAELPDATFIRNGTEYNTDQAVAHLRLKLSFAGTAVKTAEDFIVCCATGSSVTGEKYRIKFADGRMVDSAEFLRSKLATYPGPKQHAG
jgi:hypothetical protein